MKVKRTEQRKEKEQKQRGRQQTPLGQQRSRHQETKRDKFIRENLQREPEWSIYRRWKQTGIEAEFYRDPPVYYYPNKMTPVDDNTTEGIEIMLKKQWIRQVFDWTRDPGHYSKLKLVKKPTGKFRYTLACCEVNKHTIRRHFHCDDLRTLKELIRIDDYMALLDISDAFYSKRQRLHRNSRRYFRFAIKMAATVKAYEYLVTPMGWSSSPRALHIMLRETKKAAHGLGIRHARATDDIIILHQSEKVAGTQQQQYIRLLQDDDYKVAADKTKKPSRRQVWYGAQIETHPYVHFSTTTKKKKDMRRAAKYTLRMDDEGRLTPRMAAGFIGKIRSATMYLECALAHTVNLTMAQKQALAATGQQWDTPFRLTKTARAELNFFITRTDYKGRYMPNNLIELQVVTDASNSGYGGKIIRVPEDWKQHVQWSHMGFWTGEELKWHINEKELEGSVRVTKQCLSPARDYVRTLTPTVYHLNVLTDNQVSRSYVDKQGGRKQHLSKRAEDFQQWANQIFYPSTIVLTSTYLEGDEMIRIGGDELSRKGRLGEEVKLNPRMLKTLQRLLNFTPDIDLFATRHNTQLPRCYSAEHDRQATGTNAMTQLWTQRGYAFPPLSMIAATMQKIENDKATVMAMLPLIPSAAWYPMMLSLVASDPILITQGKKTFTAPNEYVGPLKRWSRWSWIGILLSWSKSGRTRDWRSKKRRKLLRTCGKQPLFQAIRQNGESFMLGTSATMARTRLHNLILSAAVRRG
mmetsp:Transcript_28499/g.39674  ORF Transcript_28499/g.39674 Transcript_28499/m.39674 type:complete len:749 (-) Transcript_28499:4684-6930(-)